MDKFVRVIVNTMIGGGGVRYFPINYKDPHPEVDYSEDGVFEREPGADVVLNLHKNFTIGLGAS